MPGNRESPAAAPSKGVFATSGGSDELVHQIASEAGLQSFDYSTFDPTSPSSWETLGKAWAATNGRSPSQEELMMFVMEFTIGMAGQAPPSAPAPPIPAGNPQAGYGWTGEHRGGPPRGRGAFRARGGRGGFAHNSGGSQKRWDVGGDDAYAAESTDAIVLGEHTNNQNGFGWAQGDSHEQEALASPDGDGDGSDGGQNGSGSTAGGRMQKVGDNWVFVRDDSSS
jgi:protein NRD1